MLSVLLSSLRRKLALAIASLALLSGTTAAAGIVTVDDPRPLAAAVKELAIQHGWQITYEDPPYLHPNDVVEQSVYDPNAAPGHKVPKGGRFSAKVAVPDRPDQQRGAAEQLVRAYNASRGGNFFAVLPGDSLVHIVPRQTIGVSGTPVPTKPILDTHVTVAPRQRSAADLIEEICRNLSRLTGTEVVVGTVPINLLKGTKISLGASNQTARSALEKLVIEMRVPLSWRLLYDPELKWYVLNIYFARS
jgi:hypothetical protein